ncbi:hypothetical protein H7E67_17605 [Clostridium gasigenes]|uniref:hypothetical protein n=1 Tax=Clostridium gasigenes TaxID=94869 RepID=UPI001624619B|nr:hypothetical protein [Clostridium gasigenes]MBB6625235.1 hypothetical protein [Clostridium gasigenes]
MNIKRIPIQICIRNYRVTWSYYTKKGHRREQIRTIKQVDIDSAKISFNEWAKTIRTMVKANILIIEEIENSHEYIEL